MELALIMLVASQCVNVELTLIVLAASQRVRMGLTLIVLAASLRGCTVNTIDCIYS